MDSLITDAGRALAAGDSLGALKRVALWNKAPAPLCRTSTLRNCACLSNESLRQRGAGDRTVRRVMHQALADSFRWVMLYGGIGVWIRTSISFLIFILEPFVRQRCNVRSESHRAARRYAGRRTVASISNIRRSVEHEWISPPVVG